MFKMLMHTVLITGLVLVVGSCGSTNDPKTEFLTFISTGYVDGNIKDHAAGSGFTTAIAAADSLCNHDPNKPNTSTYKAMLVDGMNRVACTSAKCITGGTLEHKDWVFQPNAKYYRSDGTTLVFTANGFGIFDFGTGGTTNLLDAAFGTLYIGYYTGLSQDWRTSNRTCGGSWTDNSSLYYGSVGIADQNDYESIGRYANDCSLSDRLLCVEQ